jgi:hypothetical protein
MKLPYNCQVLGDIKRQDLALIPLAIISACGVAVSARASLPWFSSAGLGLLGTGAIAAQAVSTTRCRQL